MQFRKPGDPISPPKDPVLLAAEIDSRYEDILVEIIDYNPHNVGSHLHNINGLGPCITTIPAKATPRLDLREDYRRPARKPLIEPKESFISRFREKLAKLPAACQKMMNRDLHVIETETEVINSKPHQFQGKHWNENTTIARREFARDGSLMQINPSGGEGVPVAARTVLLCHPNENFMTLRKAVLANPNVDIDFEII